MHDLHRQVEALEQRVTALELALKDGQVALSEIVGSWQRVIIDFANQYGVELPENIK